MNREEGTERKDCIICISNKIDIKLLPCEHFPICMTCASKLDKQKCPICRRRISSIRLPWGNGTMSYSTLNKLRIKMDEESLAGTLQLVFMGNHGSGKDELASTLTQIFSRTQSLLDSHSIISDFEPNVHIETMKARIEVISKTNARGVTNSELLSLKPDIFVICVSAGNYNCIENIKHWLRLSSKHVMDYIELFCVVTAGHDLSNLYDVDGTETVRAIRSIAETTRQRVRILSIVAGRSSVDLYTLGKRLSLSAGKNRTSSKTRRERARHQNVGMFISAST